MFDTVQKLKAGLRQVVEGLDPEVLEPGFASTLVDDFATLERLAAAGKALAARRVARSGAWQTQGDRSPAHWMARQTGTSVGQALGILETAKRLEDLPGTDQAVRAGKLSETQALQIASAAAANPSSEDELLKVAQVDGLAELKQRCAKVKAAAEPDELARHRLIHKSRYLRHWTDPSGAFRLDGRLTPEAGAVVISALEPHREAIFREARKQGRREPYEAYAADALVAAAEHLRSCTNTPRRSSPSTMMHIRIDHSALVRGSVESGETCEIPGIGPIAVAAAKALATDAYIAAILTKGKDIMAVAHLGRYLPSRLYTAVVERDPTCVVPGCVVRDRLQIDHTTPVAEGGPTALNNLARLCAHHHYLKTYHRYRLEGGPDAWYFKSPTESIMRQPSSPEKPASFTEPSSPP